MPLKRRDPVVRCASRSAQVLRLGDREVGDAAALADAGVGAQAELALALGPAHIRYWGGDGGYSSALESTTVMCRKKKLGARRLGRGFSFIDTPSPWLGRKVSFIDTLAFL